MVQRADAIAAVLLAAGAMLASWLLAAQLSFTQTHLDVWFESDSVYVLDQLTDRHSEHNDTNSRHPVFPVLGFGAVWTMERLFGIDRFSGADVVLLASAASFSAAAFTALRMLGRPRLVAVLFTVVLMLASPGLLFLGIHERTILGGVSIFASIIAAAAFRRGFRRQWPAVAAVTWSLGITVTNVISAVPILLAGLGRRHAIRAVAAGIGIVQAIALLATLVFPNTTVFPHIRVWRMSSVWSDMDEIRNRGGNWTQKSAAFWLHAIALPEPASQYKAIAEPPMRYVSYQKVGVMHRGVAGQVAAGLWAAALAACLLLAVRRHDPLEWAILASLGAQAVLFLLFGEETVLYAPYYVPLAVVAVSRVVAEWWEYALMRVGVSMFVAALAVSNVVAFVRARDLAITLVSATG